METRNKTLLAMERRPNHHAPAYKPNRVFETMTRVALGETTVRVWREEPTLTAALEKADGDPEVRAVIATHWAYRSLAAVIVNAGLLPGVAAIEALNQDGNGVLFYPDWR